MRTHFRELNQMGFSDQENFEKNEFIVQWVTQDQAPIIISDSDQLEEIYMMHGLSKDNKIPRFQILARPEDIQEAIDLIESGALSARNSEVNSEPSHQNHQDANKIAEGDQKPQPNRENQS